MGIAVDSVSIPCLFSIRANPHWRWRPLCKLLPRFGLSFNYQLLYMPLVSLCRHLLQSSYVSRLFHLSQSCF